MNPDNLVLLMGINPIQFFNDDPTPLRNTARTSVVTMVCSRRLISRMRGNQVINSPIARITPGIFNWVPFPQDQSISIGHRLHVTESLPPFAQNLNNC